MYGGEGETIGPRPEGEAGEHFSAMRTMETNGKNARV